MPQHNGPRPGMGCAPPAATPPLALSVSLAGLPADAVLQLTLPADCAGHSLAQLLAALFPPEEPARQAIADRLDTAANPDLPDIYDCFLPVFDQYRLGLCQLTLTAAGRPAQLSDPVAAYLPIAPAGLAALELTLSPQYRPLDYAVAQGYAESQDELLAWLRECTLLYFLDKHEYPLPARPETANAAVLETAAAGLGRQGLINLSAETGFYEITPNGRRFIGRLLTETEGYIDRFDVFKDTLWDDDLGRAEFDTGRGVDLRAQLFSAEGLDPVRTVFLLRLYDGTLDEFAADGPALIGDADFFDRLLEPAVNCDLAPEELLSAILEEGYAYAEAQDAAQQERRAQQSIARQVRALPDEK